MNCAQSVLCGLKDTLNLSDEMIDSYSQFGTGRAPDNVCGAVYAAETIMRIEEKTEQVEILREYFIKNAGSIQCKEIRTAKKMSCKTCVETATGILASTFSGDSEEIESFQAV